MKFSLNTENCEEIKLDMASSEINEVRNAIEEFCFGIASFFIDFMHQVGCKTEEQAKGLQEVCVSCIKRNVEIMIKEGLLSINEDLNREKEELVRQMKKHGYSDEEIENMTQLLIECGSIEKLNEELINLGEENELDIKKK